MLIEAGPRVLRKPSAEELSAYAAAGARKARRRGSSRRRSVTDCTAAGVKVGEKFVAEPDDRLGGWRAGLACGKMARRSDADRAGRVNGRERPDRAGIARTSSSSAIRRPSFRTDGKPVPGIAPAAKQQGAYVAKVIRAPALQAKPAPGPFRYRHQGSLATIGKSAAIIDFGQIKLKGWIAWWIWGIAHIYFLIGTRSRFAVAWSWLWTYLSGQHSARLITQKDTLREER